MVASLTRPKSRGPSQRREGLRQPIKFTVDAVFAFQGLLEINGLAPFMPAADRLPADPLDRQESGLVAQPAGQDPVVGGRGASPLQVPEDDDAHFKPRPLANDAAQ